MNSSKQTASNLIRVYEALCLRSEGTTSKESIKDLEDGFAEFHLDLNVKIRFDQTLQQNDRIRKIYIESWIKAAEFLEKHANSLKADDSRYTYSLSAQRFYGSLRNITEMNSCLELKEQCVHNAVRLYEKAAYIGISLGEDRETHRDYVVARLYYGFASDCFLSIYKTLNEFPNSSIFYDESVTSKYLFWSAECLYKAETIRLSVGIPTIVYSTRVKEHPLLSYQSNWFNDSSDLTAINSIYSWLVDNDAKRKVIATKRLKDLQKIKPDYFEPDFKTIKELEVKLRLLISQKYDNEISKFESNLNSTLYQNLKSNVKRNGGESTDLINFLEFVDFANYKDIIISDWEKYVDTFSETTDKDDLEKNLININHHYRRPLAHSRLIEITIAPQVESMIRWI